MSQKSCKATLSGCTVQCRMVGQKSENSRNIYWAECDSHVKTATDILTHITLQCKNAHCCGTKTGLKEYPLLLYIQTFPLSS